MAAVTVKEESEDPDYYQYNIQGTWNGFSFRKLLVVKSNVSSLDALILIVSLIGP